MDNMDNNMWAFGSYKLNSCKEKLVKNSSVAIEVGDIVVGYKFYRNGRPVPLHKFDYMSQPIGVVVSEAHHAKYDQDVIVVVWKGDDTTRTNYIKNNASAYLIKLS